MYTVRNPYSLRPNQTSASDVVKNQKRLANKRAPYPYGELPKSQLSPPHHSEGASKAAYSRSRLQYYYFFNILVFFKDICIKDGQPAVSEDFY